MKYKFLTTLFFLAISSIVFQFLYLFWGFNGGGYAMAPFVFVPMILIANLLIGIINLLALPKILNFKYNIALFLGIITCYFIYEQGLDFFNNLLKTSLDGYGERLMYMPVVFGSLLTLIYENRARFLK